MTERPEDVLEHGPVTLRRYRPDDLPGVDRVEIIHDELNAASGGIPRKLGFTEAGRQPLDFRPPAGTGIGVVWRLLR